MAIGALLCHIVGGNGFTLGGGYNQFLSTFYGTAAKYTIYITNVLLATVEIVTATHDNDEQYADLSWGLEEVRWASFLNITCSFMLILHTYYISTFHLHFY